MKKNMKKVVRLVSALMAIMLIVGCVGCKGKDKDNSSDVVEGHSGNTNVVSVPPIEGNSSDTSSVDATSSDATDTVSNNQAVVPDVTAPQTSTPSQSGTTSKTQVATQQPTTSVPATSTPATTSSTPATSTPAPSTGGATQGWVCPDPSAHGGTNTSCMNSVKHQQLIEQYQEILADREQNTSSRDPSDVGVKCWICGLPYGDGHNGTCYNYFENGSYTCHHYD